MSRISVLIPAYNVERFLSKCVDSILSQTFDDFEVILVDDGSSDRTGEICDEYAATDSRIKVVHQENQGISATRNCCLQYASSEYIQFIDADDWVDSNMLEVMYEKAVSRNADVVGCDFYEEYENKQHLVNVNYESKDIFFKAMVQNEWGTVWKLLIRKEIVDAHKIRFPIGINGGEDYFFVVQLLFYAKIACCVNIPLYHYNRLNNNSFISAGTLKKLMDQYEATDLVCSFLKKEIQNFNERMLDNRKIMVKSSLMMMNFFKTFKLYKEIDLIALKRGGVGKKRWLLFLLSYILNAFAGC